MYNNKNYSLPILEFDVSNYEYCGIKMKTLPIGKDLHNIVDNGYTKPTDWSTLIEDVKKNNKDAKKQIASLCIIYNHLLKR